LFLAQLPSLNTSVRSVFNAVGGSGGGGSSGSGSGGGSKSKSRRKSGGGVDGVDGVDGTCAHPLAIIWLAASSSSSSKVSSSSSSSKASSSSKSKTKVATTTTTAAAAASVRVLQAFFSRCVAAPPYIPLAASSFEVRCASYSPGFVSFTRILYTFLALRRRASVHTTRGVIV
jgi:hypothetical protein